MNIGILFLNCFLFWASEPAGNAQVAGKIVAETLQKHQFSNCLDIRMGEQERAALVPALLSQMHMSDTTGCSRKTAIETAFLWSAYRIGKEKVVRSLSGSFTLMDFEKGKMVRMELFPVAYSDTLQLAELGAVQSYGRFSFSRVEDRRLRRRILEPMLLWWAVFSSFYLLFTIR